MVSIVYPVRSDDGNMTLSEQGDYYNYYYYILGNLEIFCEGQ
jgi:hypothetical protein